MKAHEKKVDLLDLSVAERKRLCLKIRAALRERVAVGQIPVADDVIVADKSMLLNTRLNEKHDACELPRNSSLVNNLLKRVW